MCVQPAPGQARPHILGRIGKVEKLSGETVFNRVTIFPVTFEATDFNDPR